MGKICSNRDVCILSLLFICLFFVSWPVLWIHPTLNFDDFALIEPLKKISSLGDYIAAWQKNAILDIAPIRDLSYWLELQFENLTGLRNSQLINLVIWFVGLVGFDRILSLLKVNQSVRYFILFLIGLHPVLHNSVFWTAGRKHILSATFVCGSLYYFLRWYLERTKAIGLFISALFFLLALGSHPINVGFPIFIGFFLWRKGILCERKAQIYLLVTLAISAIFAFLNARYYASESYMNTGGIFAPKFIQESPELFLKRVLIIGRYLFQLMIPVKPAVVAYHVYDWPSYVGVGLMVGTGITFIKYLRQIPWEWVLFIVLPISVVTVRLTSQGGNDTYLLTPLLGLGFLLAILLSRVSIQNNLKCYKIVAILILALFAFQDFRMAQIWSNENKIWEYGYQSEKSFAAKVFYARSMINQSSPDLILVEKLLNEIRSQNIPSSSIGYIAGKMIYLKSISPDEKLKLFEKYNIDDPWFVYYWSAEEAQTHHFSEGFEKLKSAWFKDPRKFYIQFQFYIDELEKKWTLMCQYAKQTNCQDIHQWIGDQKQKMENSSRE